MRASFDREQATTVERCEIAKREFVMLFCFFAVSAVDPKMPFRVFAKAVHSNELAFLAPRGPMTGPRAFPVGYDATFSDQLLCELERRRI